MHIAPLIRDLAVILAVAGIVTLVFQKLRQPVVLGYIVAGIIVGRSLSPLPLVADTAGIQIWAQLGVIFLMFSLGLEFSFRKLTRVGISAGLTALFEVSFMLVLGYTSARWLGWTSRESLFWGAMLCISSTTIIVRALDELGVKTRRFSEMILALLVVEDLIAILILVLLSTLGTNINQGFPGLTLLTSAARLMLVVGVWFVTGYFIVPRFVRYVGRIGTNEMLTIVSLALCLCLVLFSAYFGYSVALGAFIMGSILAESSESSRIEERIEPLRDLFAAIFFVSVGMMIDPRVLWAYKGTILLFSTLVITGKIVGTTFGSLLTGQTLRTSVQVGFGVAQIGEFSFIIATLGLTLHAIPPHLYPIAVAISLLTTFTTPYLIRHSHTVAVELEKRLPIGVRNTMMQYVTWTRERAADAATRQVFYQLFFKWLINGMIVSAFFIILSETLLPWLRLHFYFPRRTLATASWLVAALSSSPFIWAMMAIFRDFWFSPETQASHPPRGGTLLLMRVLTLFWIALLSLKFFSLKAVALLVIGCTAIMFLLFRRQLEKTYQWFEQRFISTFDPMDKTPSPRDLLRHLAPWDAHLVRIKVHPNSEVVLKSISQAHLRSRYQVNVVVIQRGLKSMVAPKPDEVILPKDELLVLGTDEQIDLLRPLIEKPPGLGARFATPQPYELTPIRLNAHCTLAGRTLRDSGVSEEFNAMIVGIERGESRLINPRSDIVLQSDDILWAVGLKENLTRLCSRCSEPV